MSRRDEDEPPDAAVTVVEHVCVPPRWMTRAILALTAALLATLVSVAFGAVYVYQANQYVQGRGEFRDAEARRLEEQIRRSVCDLLDQLPEGGLLERPRAKYGCGPGIPVEQLTPDERQQLADRSTAAVAPRSDTPAPSSAAPSAPPATGGPRQPTEPPPAPSTRPEPPPPADPSPLLDVGGLTDPLCQSAIVCF